MVPGLDMILYIYIRGPSLSYVFQCMHGNHHYIVTLKRVVRRNICAGDLIGRYGVDESLLLQNAAPRQTPK